MACHVVLRLKSVVTAAAVFASILYLCRNRVAEILSASSLLGVDGAFIER